MGLPDLWRAQPAEFENKSIQQILAFAGDGKLRDDSTTSLDLRQFLDQIDSPNLIKYATQCLTDGFPDSGLVLQDIVNQMGKRLGFTVQFGRYRGTSSAIGHDGLWTTSQGVGLVVEVKTTDTYQISLEPSVAYRKKLVELNSIDEEKSSILYVVGRSNTSDFESQVRGSRHAWDIRLIGVDSLSRLLRLRESMDDPAILEKIRSILRPAEYTRVDGIIDLVFTTTSEATKDEQIIVEDGDAEPETSKRLSPVSFRDECFAKLSTVLHTPLVRRSPAIQASPDGKIGVYCAISRLYQNPTSTGYWFGFHPGQRDALALYETAYVAFGCGSPNNILLIPFQIFKPWLLTFNQTILEDRFYWHVKFEESAGQWINIPKAEFQKRDVTRYLVPSG